MKRASPVEMRRAMEIVDEFRRSGILFVAVPVLNENDRRRLSWLAGARLEKIIPEIEDGESK